MNNGPDIVVAHDSDSESDKLEKEIEPDAWGTSPDMKQQMEGWYKEFVRWYKAILRGSARHDYAIHHQFLRWYDNNYGDRKKNKEECEALGRLFVSWRHNRERP